MDLSDLPRRQAAAAGLATPLDAQALTAQLGGEVAGALTSALDRVNALTATGRIDREGLRALRAEIDRARRAGIVGQQIARLAAGQVQQAQERVDLTGLLREALRQRTREIGERGIELRQQLAAAVITSDATLVFALLQALLDWCFDHALARVDLALEPGVGAAARLRASFAHRPAESAADTDEFLAGIAGAAPAEAALDTMPWRLVQQIAARLELALERRDTPTRTSLVVDFPRQPAGVTLAGDDDEPVDTGPDPFDAYAEFGVAPVQAGAAWRPDAGPARQPLTGRHVLVLAARRDVRAAVRDALRPLGMQVDFVYSVDDARTLCDDATPDAVVWEASLGGERFDRLRTALSAARTAPAFVEIVEPGADAAPAQAGARIGSDAVATTLPGVLAQELARQRGRWRGR